MLVTGSSDGLIRVISIFPNKILGLVGEHSDMPIERLTMSFDKNMLASSSHDKTVMLWKVDWLTDEGAWDEDDMEVEDGEEDEGVDAINLCLSGFLFLLFLLFSLGEEV